MGPAASTDWTGCWSEIDKRRRVPSTVASSGCRTEQGLRSVTTTPPPEEGGGADSAGGTWVIPIRTATNTALPPIKVGGYSDAIAITPDGKTAYVADPQSGTVIPIRTATNTALPPIQVAGHPSAMAITPDGKTAYVASDEGTVTPIRTTANTALPPIKMGHLPEIIAIATPPASPSDTRR